jgi:hypothetical protein
MKGFYCVIVSRRTDERSPEFVETMCAGPGVGMMTQMPNQEICPDLGRVNSVSSLKRPGNSSFCSGIEYAE